MVIAITQHITYNEYLRLLIGNDFRDEIPEYGASLEVDPTLTAHVNGMFRISLDLYVYILFFIGKTFDIYWHMSILWLNKCGTML